MKSLQRRRHELAVHRLDDRGATIVEYALLVALIAVVSVGALSLLGLSASDAFDEAAVSVGFNDGQQADPGGGDGSDGGDGSGGDDDGSSGDDGGFGAEEVDDSEESEPPAASTEFAAWSASRSGNSHNWSSDVMLSVAGSDGSPLQGSAQVTVSVTTSGTDWRGNSYSKTEEREVAINNGSGSTSDDLRDEQANSVHPAVTSVTYEIVDVAPIAGGTGVEWDRSGASITVLAP